VIEVIHAGNMTAAQRRQAFRRLTRSCSGRQATPERP
jgi:hypothetical protein